MGTTRWKNFPAGTFSVHLTGGTVWSVHVDRMRMRDHTEGGWDFEWWNDTEGTFRQDVVEAWFFIVDQTEMKVID